jgi:hypothetical protein
MSADGVHFDKEGAGDEKIPEAGAGGAEETIPSLRKSQRSPPSKKKSPRLSLSIGKASGHGLTSKMSAEGVHFDKESPGDEKIAEAAAGETEETIPSLRKSQSSKKKSPRLSLSLSKASGRNLTSKLSAEGAFDKEADTDEQIPEATVVDSVAMLVKKRSQSALECVANMQDADHFNLISLEKSLDAAGKGYYLYLLFFFFFF